jgi:hypothetical protein
MEQQDMYTVVVSRTSFCLSGESLLSDGSGANIIAKRLFGNPETRKAGVISFDRNPLVFALVRDHLRGYDVLPLDKADCGDLSEAKMLRYLLNDAIYYGLKKLEGLVDEEIFQIEVKAKQSAAQEALRESPHLIIGRSVDLPVVWQARRSISKE